MIPAHRIRSYVIRGGRGTSGQARATTDLWPEMGLELQQGMLDYAKVFQRHAPTCLEIGFGTGQSLLAAAKAFPHINFIGIETHRPGIGALLMGVESEGLTNIRVFRADVVDVLAQCVPDNSLSSIQIFFPDPWQKRRHHPRRLIQSAFLKTLINKLLPVGQIHLATDWDDYAKHMMQVVSAEPLLTNAAGHGCFGERSPLRPVLSKFEQRALREGRQVWELQLIK